ncbi:SSS sodium solute transporter superfamily [Haliscomenobacter hydrossis DSM 1100]|uniref:SSS sodium solute transporter superfamily n=2 Tax=Haliscomenobacter TaxID=2349 RepID=F4KT94_HALH1|nr:SSS sodium solute transporter superfamily [Haliscomenobacter hydrossis DSM 1100]
MINWYAAGQLPVPSIGVAGAFVGISEEVLMVAGGANFPDGTPWKGAQKKYHATVYVYEKAPGLSLIPQAFQLNQACAYGAAVSTPRGILCIGGENERGPIKSVFLLRWNAAARKVEFQNYPDLPFPLSNLAASQIGNKVYVVGGENSEGASKQVLCLDLSAAQPRWDMLPPAPQALSHTVLVSQSNGEYPCLYLLGGRTRQTSGISTLHNSVYQYDPKKSQWITLSPIRTSADTSITLSAAMGVAQGATSILLFGGDRGTVFTQIEQLNAALARRNSALEKASLQTHKEALLDAHPGFNKDVLLFNTVTKAWTKVGELPYAPVTTAAVKWGEDIFIPSGEVRPGVRTTQILAGSIAKQSYFSWLDYAVLSIYLLLMVGIGLYTAKNQTSTDDYFRGGQRIPGWAAGLSIYGTQLSAITFMSIPAKTYATNWNYFFLQMTIIMIIPVITQYFIPFYRRLQITSAYEYLEKRFDYTIRALASLLYVLLQLGRLAIVLLLPSLALTLVAGIDVNLCILLMGLITIFYTMKGGIEAVIWTDVAQVVVLLGGALLCLIMIPFQVPHTPAEQWQILQDNHKLQIVNSAFNFSEPTLWVVLIGGLAINVITYGADQSVVQKYLTTKDEAGSRKSLQLGAWMALPSALIFFSIGSLLYLFYQSFPEKHNYQLQSQDAIFPWYIVSELPAGLTGLVIAAVFAAAMSTLSSSMNSVTTALTTDFYRKFYPHKTEQRYLKLAKTLTLWIGVVGTGLALLMAHWGISSLWDQFNTILGLFTGGLGGLFVLGLFFPKANARGALLGLLLSGLIQYWITQYTSINFLLYAFTGLAACVAFGYVFSLLWPSPPKDLAGLTVYTI